MSLNKHIHQLSDEQLICDNEQCREKLLDEIQDMKIEFDKIVEKNSKTNQINNTQAWKIIQLTSKELSQKLIHLFNKQEINDVIENYLQEKNTKQIFNSEKNRISKNKFITKEQLWDIYMNMCHNAIEILSKTKRNRQTHVANFSVIDENCL